MKAMVYDKYGPPDVLQLREVAKPAPHSNDVLVRVHATAVTAADWRMRKADPFAARIFNGPFRPRRITVLGMVFAGEIETTGSDVRRFKAGDPVYGHNDLRFGAYAEYLRVPQTGMIALKPANMSFEEAAAVPFGGLAALHMVRKANIQAGHRVLVFGASGNTGIPAVQLARHHGAHVTAVCSARNIEWVRLLGAESVIDYHQQDVTDAAGRYDVVLDAVGRIMSGIPESKFKHILRPDGVYASVEHDRKDRVQDLDVLRELIEADALKAVIDRRFPLEQVAEAHRYVESGKKQGNVVIVV